MDIWFNEKANNWNEAIPIGNGHIAGMILVELLMIKSSLMMRLYGIEENVIETIQILINI